MAHTVEQWAGSVMAQMPQGTLWPRSKTSRLYKYASGYASRLEAVEVSADSLLLEMRPDTTFAMLDEWEAYLGLPECQIQSLPFELRRAVVVEKYYRKSGLQSWNIEKLCSDLGFDIEVEEIFPHHCLRDCNYPLHEEKYRHLLRINVKNITENHASCLDNCLTPLISETAAFLECTLNKIKLGGKYYEYIYPEEVSDASTI